MTLEKVKLESRGTPKQIVEGSVITTDNFQTAEQCSSNTAALTHALLIDEFDVANENGSYYLLANKKCFQATMYSTEPGALEHNNCWIQKKNFELMKYWMMTGRALMKIYIVKAAFLHGKWIKPYCKKKGKLMELPESD